MTPTINNDSCPSKTFPLVIEVPIITTKELQMAEYPLHSRYYRGSTVSPLQRLQVKKGGLIKTVGVIIK